MPKLRKQRKAKKYMFNLNRKRMRNKFRNNGKIACPEIKKAWTKSKTVAQNLTEMGLCVDPNKTLAIPNIKTARIEQINGLRGASTSVKKAWRATTDRRKLKVVPELEAAANAIRDKNFRFPKGEVALMGHYLLKYKLDYKAMVRDKKNYDQLTWKQLRTKIRQFIKIPEQFDPFLAEHNLQMDELVENENDDDDDLLIF